MRLFPTRQNRSAVASACCFGSARGFAFGVSKRPLFSFLRWNNGIIRRDIMLNGSPNAAAGHIPLKIRRKGKSKKDDHTEKTLPQRGYLCGNKMGRSGLSMITRVVILQNLKSAGT